MTSRAILNGWPLGVGQAFASGITPPPVPPPTPTPSPTARQVATLYAPGHSGEGLNTGDGTAKTYTTPTLTNLSGKPMTTASIVNAGWITAADGQGQERLVGNDYPLAGIIKDSTGTTVGTFTWGGATSTSVANGTNVASDAVALSTPIPSYGEFTVTLTGTVPSGASYPPKFGLVGVRTHTTTDGLNPVSILLTGDSIMALQSGSEVGITAAESIAPVVIMAVTGNTLEKAAGSLFARRADLLTKLGATVLLNELSVNSIGFPVATLTGWAGGIADQARAAGVSPWHSTMTPKISTNIFTLEGQVPTTDEPNRQAFNTAVRGLLSGKIDRVVEFADATEHARNDGRFRTGAADGRYLKAAQRLFEPKITVGLRVVLSATVFDVDFAATLGLLNGSQTITCITGANAGASRTVTGSTGRYTAATAWDVQPSIGDTFEVNLIPSTFVYGTVDKIHLSNRQQNNGKYGTHFMAADALRFSILEAFGAAGYKSPPRVGVTYGSDPNNAFLFSSTGDLVVTYGTTRPADAPKAYNNALDDDTLLILAVETANEAVATPSGWTLLTSVGTGTAGGTSATRLTLFWRRHVVGVQSVTLIDPGDHVAAYVLAIPDAVQTGDPIDAVQTGTQAAGAAATTWPSITTTADNALVIAFMSDQIAADAVRISGATAPSLSRVDVNFNWATSTGNGGGMVAFSGVQRAAGAVTAPTANHASTAAIRALATVAIKGR